MIPLLIAVCALLAVAVAVQTVRVRRVDRRYRDRTRQYFSVIIAAAEPFGVDVDALLTEAKAIRDDAADETGWWTSTSSFEVRP